VRSFIGFRNLNSGRAVPAVVAGITFASFAWMATTAAHAALPNTPNKTWGTDGRISAILPVGNTIYVGGSFAHVVDRSGGTHPAANVAAFNATTGAAITNWSPSTDGAVQALATDGTRIFVGGNFSTVDGKAHANLAAVDALTGRLSTWNAGTTAVVDSIVATGGAVYIGGNFKRVKDATGATFNRAYVAKLTGMSPTLATGWQPSPDARVRALVPSQDGNRLFLGGDFTTLGRANTNRTAAVLTSTGALDPYASTANNSNSYATVYDLDTDGTRLFEAVGGSGGACTVVNAATGARIYSKHTNGNVHGVNVVSGTVYCGGHFSGAGSFDGQTRSKMAAFDLTSGADLAFAPTINSALGVWATAADATHEYAGGDFTKVSGQTQNHYAQWTDSTR
jgi:hypothetical protein